jgi:hypothetical protein
MSDKMVEGKALIVTRGGGGVGRGNWPGSGRSQAAR